MPKRIITNATPAAITTKLAPDDPNNSPLLLGLTTLADLLQREADELRSNGAGAFSASRDQRRGEAALPQTPEDEQLEELDTFVYRIRQISEWLK